jgi:hypothetical protein
MAHHYVGFSTEKNIKLFSYNELRSATDNFHRDNKVGRGGFGTVYKVLCVSIILFHFILFLSLG